ncbi:hypothetical protein PAXRUDRAFT_198935 [Paxillus rubicundulus Ve08.2h10]|uniref:Major facilitator superfamily (MFS) profile domain-containing protein n=1 Tax=Paxillus rubicundulus Ve08.2h10 TaxID=930991 RepID=A0A0D0CZS6_9AGAM|nr:hypothetical protein PAXRUDRAFT_198935 [Paxillus rubicundulus Ve08.2h10]
MGDVQSSFPHFLCIWFVIFPTSKSASLTIYPVFPSRMRPRPEYCFDTYLSLPWRNFCSRSTVQLWVYRLTHRLAPSHYKFSALISDIWGAKERGAALAIFTVAPFAGPAIGPIVGGYLYQAGVSWRWLFWILALFVSKVVNVSIGET